METPADEMDETSRALVGCTTLWASPLTRALQTAMLSLQPLLEQPGAVLELKQNARERKNWGGLDSIGTSVEERRPPFSHASHARARARPTTPNNAHRRVNHTQTRQPHTRAAPSHPLPTLTPRQVASTATLARSAPSPSSALCRRAARATPRATAGLRRRTFANWQRCGSTTKR